MTLPILPRRAAVLVAALWTSVCLALPAPHEIEQAVRDGQLPQAEHMLREVIAEKPRSARAHYELAQVLAREGEHAQALQAIRTARELDPSLSFAQSAEKFNAVVQAIEQQGRTARSPSAPQTAPSIAAPAQATPGATPTWLWPALLSAGFALLVLTLWRRMQLRPTLQTAGAANAAPEGPRGFGAQYDPRSPATGYGSPYPTPSSGSGVTGAVVGGLAGVAAGYALSKALEGHDHPGSAGNSSAANRTGDPMEDVGLVRMDPSAPDGTLGDFDAGTGDDWGPSDDSDSW